MDLKKQQLLFEYLISSVDIFALCTPIIKSEYFDPDLRDSVRFIQSYYNEYHALPDPDQIMAESGKRSVKRLITKDRIEYCANEIEKFCKRKAMGNAIKTSVDLYNKGKYEEIDALYKDALTISLHRDMGINFFDDPDTILQRLLKSEKLEPTGWSEFDDALFGGLARKQMILFSANSGEGKSITMSNLALNYVEQGKNALILTLELSEEMKYIRYISMVTKIPTREWKNRIDEVSKKIISAKDSYGNLHLKRMPNGSTANNFRAYLKEFELLYGYIPDIIVVDYIDLVNPNEKGDDGVFEKDKRSTEEVREIGNDYNAIIVTASQQNREAIKTQKRDHSHIAGGKSKINTTDVYVTITQTEMMRAQGEIQFTFLKTRTSDGLYKIVTLNFDKKTLRITDPKGLVFNQKIPNESTEHQHINNEDENDDLLTFAKTHATTS